MESILDLAKDSLAAVVDAVAADPKLAVPLVTSVLILVRFSGLRRAALLAVVAAAQKAPIPDEYKLGVAVFALLPSGAAAAGGRAAPATASDRAAHRARLVAFYEKHAPAKVADVDATLARYLGHEDELFARLEKKYAGGDAPKPARARAAARSPVAAPAVVDAASPVEKARSDARAAMEERINARLARKK